MSNEQGFVPNEDSIIESVETMHTGGNIYNDVIMLKNGYVIRLSDDCITVSKNEKEDDEGNNLWHTYF